MLSRFEGKAVRITTEDGSVFTGTAEAFPSGYGLDVFGVEEECVQIDDTVIFLSEIQKIESVSDNREPVVSSEQCNAFVSRMFEKPYRVADILPMRVPNDAPGQYFAVDRYYRMPEQMESLHTKHAHIILRLNCFYDLIVSFDGGITWEKNPEPDGFVKRMTHLTGGDFMRALCLPQETMIEIDAADTYLSVYGEQPAMTELVRQLTLAEGFFLREPMRD